jgi:hypothetical protein
VVKKKAVPAPAPAPEPNYLDFLVAPKVVAPTPTSWIEAPSVKVGGERVGDPVRRSSGPLLPAIIREVPDPTPALTVPAPAPLVAQPERKRKQTSKPKNLTEARKRTQKIRVWMLSQFSRPEMETYREAMDAARIAPTPACLRAGKRSFKESWQVPRLRQTISAEFSRLWDTREPKTRPAR